jgi:hypothetical protein
MDKVVAFLIWTVLIVGGIWLLGTLSHNNNSPETDCGGDICQGDISNEKYSWDN